MPAPLGQGPPRGLGPFTLVAIAFRELRLALASRASLLRLSGVEAVAEVRKLSPAHVDEFVRVRRTAARIFALFGVLAPVCVVVALGALWWWPESQGNAVIFGVHLGVGGTLVFVLSSIVGMVAAGLLTRGLARDLQRRK